MLCVKVSASSNACPVSIKLQKGKVLTVNVNHQVLRASKPSQINGTAKLVFSQYDALSPEYFSRRVASCVYSRKKRVISATIVSASNTGLLPKFNNKHWIEKKLPGENQWKCFAYQGTCDWLLRK